MEKETVSIEVKTGATRGQAIEAPVGANLLEVLRQNNHSIVADCNGRGTCGKCKVSIGGETKLACETTVEKGMEVTILSKEENFSIEVGYSAGAGQMSAAEECKRPCIAVDIGTTTVVLQLIDGDTGKVAKTRSFLNGQRQYGADVVTRIQYAEEGGKETLVSSIRTDLAAAIDAVCVDAGISGDSLEHICIAGNTTMMYLLLDYSCKSLGVFPFQPAFPIHEQYTYAEVFGKEGLSCPIYLLPWVSAYVGGDVTAGYLACCAGPEETALLIDMGTNGEMMLWSGEKNWCTSTAAGPAFEGGGITFGTGSIPGAISLVDIVDGKIICETIGGAAPVGICGSGVLDAGARMIQAEYVDETGRMEQEYAKTGVTLAESATGKPILFMQKDIRELQLAKSAVRAGVEILLSEAGITVDQLDVVYLAGGFGQKLRLDSAVAIGLLSQELADKARPSGNSSLGGSVRVCMDLGLMKTAHEMSQKSKEVMLSTHKDFQNLFMDYMAFDE